VAAVIVQIRRGEARIVGIHFDAGILQIGGQLHRQNDGNRGTIINSSIIAQT
jgi:hypothetical protein